MRILKAGRWKKTKFIEDDDHIHYIQKEKEAMFDGTLHPVNSTPGMFYYVKLYRNRKPNREYPVKRKPKQKDESDYQDFQLDIVTAPY